MAIILFIITFCIWAAHIVIKYLDEFPLQVRMPCSDRKFGGRKFGEREQ